MRNRRLQHDGLFGQLREQLAAEDGVLGAFELPLPLGVVGLGRAEDPGAGQVRGHQQLRLFLNEDLYEGRCQITNTQPYRVPTVAKFTSPQNTTGGMRKADKNLS